MASLPIGGTVLEVGVRELKSRLSYYLHLMAAGETVAIKIRDHIVGFLTNREKEEKGAERPWPRKKLLQRIERLKEEGLVVRGGLCRMRPVKRIRLKGGLSASELIRKMRDEEW